MMEVILFDFGGTLDTNGIHWSEKFWDSYVRARIPITKALFEEAYRYSEGLMAERTRPTDDMQTMLSNQIHFQVQFLNEAYYSRINDLTINDMVADCWADVLEQITKSMELLYSLSKHYRLGLVSNFTGNLEVVVKSLSLYEYFKVIVDSQVVNISKPDPDIYKYAVEKLGVTPEKVFMVGDSYDRDIEPAKSIGCSTIWLDVKSWKKPKSTEAADYIISDLDDVSKIVLENKNHEQTTHAI